MKLKDNKELFNIIVQEIENKNNINSAIIEKDYHVTNFLKEIVKVQPNIMFKGGTSLSKCYKVINRFSEDIDLTLIYEERVTEGQRRALANNIKNIISNDGYILLNPEDIRSRRDFNRYKVDFHPLYITDYIKPIMLIETSLIVKSYPYEVKQVSSYFYDYLKEKNREDLIEKYELEPFNINVQTLQRTLIDKVFALCDYYLKNSIVEHSRHIYDIYKILGTINIDNSVKELFLQVKNDRSNNKTCLSAQDGFDVKQCVTEIIEKEIFKEDFAGKYKNLIYEDINYETAINGLIKIRDSILFH